RPSGDEYTTPGPSSWMPSGAVITPKLAVTAWELLIVTEQAPSPVQSPLHPWKNAPGEGVAVSVTLAGVEKSTRQERVQDAPDEVATVPYPARSTFRKRVRP